MPATREATNRAALLDSLNPSEREVLGLLASGHTVKSIAACLGRSEPSINERLREARRKTGISSSRELARLLSAQENCHEKTGVPTAPSPDEALSARHAALPFKLWGVTIMLMLSAAALTVFALAGPASNSVETQPVAASSAAPARQSPLAGVWSVDVSRLPMPPAERPRKVTIAFAFAADHKLTTAVNIVESDGTQRHAEGTCPLDGTPCTQISGNMDWLDSSSLRQPSPGTLVQILGKNGATVSTRIYTVSRDRRSMTETVMWASGNRIPSMETNYFTRIR